MPVVQSGGNSFTELSSQTALTWPMGIKYMIANIFRLLLFRFNILIVVEENAYIKKYSTLQQETQEIGL